MIDTICGVIRAALERHAEVRQALQQRGTAPAD
jgi:hypothetical protein